MEGFYLFIKHFIMDHRAPLLTIEVGLALGIGLSFILLLLIILSLVPRHLKGWRWKGWSQAVDVY